MPSGDIQVKQQQLTVVEVGAVVPQYLYLDGCAAEDEKFLLWTVVDLPSSLLPSSESV